MREIRGCTILECIGNKLEAPASRSAKDLDICVCDHHACMSQDILLSNLRKTQQQKNVMILQQLCLKDTMLDPALNYAAS